MATHKQRINKHTIPRTVICVYVYMYVRLGMYICKCCTLLLLFDL